MENRTVALVGKPNVGKSRLFNRLVGRRLSIVHDQPGVTRDIVSAEVKKDFMLLDTGGLGLVSTSTPKKLIEASEEQVDFAIQAASLILFVVDGQAGCSPLDEIIADRLRNSRKKVLLIVNKIDREKHAYEQDDFRRLGFGEPLWVSAEHNIGTENVFREIYKHLGEKSVQVDVGDDIKRIKISFVGRPNVGKSSLSNRLLKEDRMIVSDVPGTTRDAIEVDLDWEREIGSPWHFRLIDTAGLRSKGKLDSSVEFFSGLRTEDSMQESDVIFQVIDAKDGITRLDKVLAGKILEMGKPVVLLVNKWDYAMETFEAGDVLEEYTSLREFQDHFEEAVRDELFFLPDSPILFVSALTGFSVERILKQAVLLDRRMNEKLPTARLNKLITELIDKQKPKNVAVGKAFRAYYSVQVDNRPFKIRVFCNREIHHEESYLRYLGINVIRHFKLNGCPVFFEMRGKEKRYGGEGGEVLESHNKTQKVRRLTKSGTIGQKKDTLGRATPLKISKKAKGNPSTGKKLTGKGKATIRGMRKRR